MTSSPSGVAEQMEGTTVPQDGQTDVQDGETDTQVVVPWRLVLPVTGCHISSLSGREQPLSSSLAPTYMMKQETDP